MPKRSHGLSRTPTYRAWEAAKRRCFNPNSTDFADYGGRGITMCDRWRDSFEAFLADMGECPSRLLLERIDNNGNYEPGNCCWDTLKKQARNTRRNHLINYEGKMITVAEVAEKTGLNPKTIYTRLYTGWSEVDAINPTLRRNQYV